MAPVVATWRPHLAPLLRDIAQTVLPHPTETNTKGEALPEAAARPGATGVLAAAEVVWHVALARCGVTLQVAVEDDPPGVLVPLHD